MTGRTTDGDASSFATRRVVLALLLAGICRTAVGQNNTTQSCSNFGVLRLVGGSTAREGTVEICLNSIWGTVCDNFFGTTAAQVVCRQLGYPASGAISNRTAQFGQGSGPVHIGAVHCDGSEQRIVDCTLNYENNCVHSEDAGVECSFPCTPEGGVRLTGGDRPGRGTVWVCISGTWSTVCHNFWNIPDARVVCRQLEYGSQDAQAFSSAYYGEGFGPILLDYVACNGTEATLLDCSHTNHSQCDHNSDAGVDCAATGSSVDTSPSQSAITLIPSYLTSTLLWSSLSSNITGVLTATPTQVTKSVSSQSFVTLTSTMQTSMFLTVFMSSTQLSKSIESVSQSATPITQTSLTVQLPLSSFSQSESTATPETLFTSLTESSSRSALIGTSLLTQYTSSSSLTETLSQSKSIATSSSTPFPLSTTSTPLQTTPLDTISLLSSSILNLQSSRDSFSFTIATPTQPPPSYTPLSLSSYSLASSTTPSGGGGALSLPAVESISIAAVTIFIVIVFVVFITIGACLYRRKRKTGRAEYDLNADTNPLTGSQHGTGMCVYVHIEDIQSQDGNSLVDKDACPTQVVEKFELRERQIETGPVRLLVHQESSHSSLDQRQDLPAPRSNSPTVSDSQKTPHSDTQDPTRLQEAKGDTSGAEEVELRVMNDYQKEQASSDMEATLYTRNTVDERQDLSIAHPPVTVIDSQQPPHTDATSLQQTSDDTSVAEEVELKVLGDDQEEQASNAPLYTMTSGDHSDTGEEVEMHRMESEKQLNRHNFDYQNPFPI